MTTYQLIGQALTNRVLSAGVECTLMTLIRFSKPLAHELVRYWLRTSLWQCTPVKQAPIIYEVFTHIPSNRRNDHTPITFYPPLEPSPCIFRHFQWVYPFHQSASYWKLSENNPNEIHQSEKGFTLYNGWLSCGSIPFSAKHYESTYLELASPDTFRLQVFSPS
jgi:hypothetical protein